MNQLSANDQALLNDLLDDRLDADAAQAVQARIEAEPAMAEGGKEPCRGRQQHQVQDGQDSDAPGEPGRQLPDRGDRRRI